MAEAVSQLPQITQRQEFIATRHTGPIPEPATLEGYGRIDPTFPERIVKMAELEQQQRHANEKLVIAKQTADWAARRGEIRRGQFCGLAVCLTAIVGGCVVAALGYQWAGGFIGAGGLAGIVTSFIFQASAPRNLQDAAPSSPNDEPTKG